MRTLLWALVVAGALGTLALTPQTSDAQWARTGWVRSYYAPTYWTVPSGGSGYYSPAYSSYYYATPSYAYTTPGYYGSYMSSYYNPAYTSSYYTPGYSTYYTPNYSNYYYPGYSSY